MNDFLLEMRGHDLPRRESVVAVEIVVVGFLGRDHVVALVDQPFELGVWDDHFMPLGDVGKDVRFSLSGVLYRTSAAGSFLKCSTPYLAVTFLQP